MKQRKVPINTFRPVLAFLHYFHFAQFEVVLILYHQFRSQLVTVHNKSNLNMTTFRNGLVTAVLTLMSASSNHAFAPTNAFVTRTMAPSSAINTQLQEQIKNVYLACDGFGKPLQDAIEEHLATLDNITVKNLGSDTYYDAAAKLAQEMQKEEDTNAIGVLFCGTGMGVGMVANKFKGVRAATCENTMAAKYARAVNNANVLCLGELVTPADIAVEILEVFMKQGFVEHPIDEEGEKVGWWSKDVETFLKSSMDGVENVENQALGK